MLKTNEVATEFLDHKRVAVSGVSRHPANHGSDVVYARLRERGYEVFAINPNTEEVEGDTCYHDLKSVPGGVDWVVIGTRPETAEETMRECVELGIGRVWMHRSFGAGRFGCGDSVRPRARGAGHRRRMPVHVYEPTADPGHKVMKAILSLTGQVPRHCS